MHLKSACQINNQYCGIPLILFSCWEINKETCRREEWFLSMITPVPGTNRKHSWYVWWVCPAPLVHCSCLHDISTSKHAMGGRKERHVWWVTQYMNHIRGSVASGAYDWELGAWVPFVGGKWLWPLQVCMSTKEFRETGIEKSTYVPSHL